MSAQIDMIDSRHGRLRVTSYSHAHNGAFWNCICDCGEQAVVSGRLLRKGVVKSCGCGSLAQAVANARASAVRRRGKHWPLSRKLKELRRNMIARCYDPENKRFANYGGRGVMVCDEWLNDRSAFYDWVIDNGWSESLTIERVDVNGNYEPSNVRFVPMQEQQNNTTRSRVLEWAGRKMTVSEWARDLGVRPQALQHRVDRGWRIERIFTQPFRKVAKRK